jgi:phosphatidylglycerophosphatase A
MKYILSRIMILIIAIAAIYIVRYYVADHAAPDHKYGYIEGVIVFFRLLSILVITSIGIFSYEAYRFNKRGRIKERNNSLILIATVLLLLAIWGVCFLGLGL